MLSLLSQHWPCGASCQMTEWLAVFIPLCFQVDRLSQQLQNLETDLDAAKSPVVSNASKAAAEAKQHALAAAEAEAAGANARQEHSQAMSRLSASVKKLEVRLCLSESPHNRTRSY